MSKQKKPLRFEYWKSTRNNQWYWRVRSGNGEPIAQGEGYKSKRGIFNVYDALYGWAAEQMCGHSHWPEAVDVSVKRAPKKPKHYEGKLNRNWP